MSGAELQRAVDVLVNRVGHWPPARWGAKADLVHDLVQRLADRCADAEAQPRRPVPRLDNDLVLPDQLRVVATDLVAADPPDEVLATATADVTEVTRAL